MDHKARREEGYTLVEILAAMVILSVAALVMTSFFFNAMTYSKGNANKTIVVNLARNALFYIEKQSFKKMESYFLGGSSQEGVTEATGTENNPRTISTAGCVRNEDRIFCNSNLPLQQLFTDIGVSMWDVLTPVVNGQQYEIVIEYDPDLGKDDLRNYLLPIKVKAMSSNYNGENRNSTEVEGYIPHEQIS
ncbi:MAG: type II secretion system protein [Candidatus Cohnella colombiensis]|uniref:Type II secretion system protein n=1 Tax=Candidatus Cohnella colombiensis TaxID=3121368 RepID=A0AA95EY02_9BACL|nr:MAG: type II secretion system protein [Cohnella sp.]